MPPAPTTNMKAHLVSQRSLVSAENQLGGSAAIMWIAAVGARSFRATFKASGAGASSRILK